MLRVGVERAKVGVRGGRAASVRVIALGTTGPDAAAITTRPGVAAPWLQVVPTAAERRAIVFDPTLGERRPPPGTYRVVVVVEQGGERASTAIEFEVERHPCLQIGPKPTLTWNAVTSTATLNVSLWNCGNVGLDVGWAVRADGQRVSVEPATVTVDADARWVNSSITFSIPGGLDADTEIDVHTLSPAGAQPVLSRRPSRLRRHRRLLGVAGMLIVLVGGWMALAEASGGHHDTVTVVGEPTTTGTTVPAVPAAARLVVDGPAKQTLGVTAGLHAEVTFSIRNAGGRAADVRAFATAVAGFTIGNDCAGPLAAGDRCSITVAFDPPKPGTYLVAIEVLERTTAQRLRLSLTGQAVITPTPTAPVS